MFNSCERKKLIKHIYILTTKKSANYNIINVTIKEIVAIIIFYLFK